MLIIPQTVEMKWAPKYRAYYESKGYIFTAYRDKFEVNIMDLPLNSNKIIYLLCDYCLEQRGIKKRIQRSYKDYIKYKQSIVPKDCCKDCKPLKIKESNLIKYGVESTNQLRETMEKRIRTNIKKYGGKNCMDSQQVREKVVKTNMKRYGAKAPAQNKLVKEKIKNTNMKKYGGVSPTNNIEVRNKQLSAMVKKYGVPYGMKNKNIMEKSRLSLYMNGNVPTSRQQKYIHLIVEGELNYPFKNYSLDIAFPNKKIYIECDFGGHELQIKLGSKTEDEFKREERKRWYALYRKGWKEIRIISKKDKVPSEEKVKDMMEFCLKKFNENKNSWIRFDLDNNLVSFKNESRIVEENYDFGELFYIYIDGFKTM